MDKERFLKDLKIVYELIANKTKEINDLYSLAQNDEGKKHKTIKKLLKICSLSPTKQNILAILNRLINLREDLLVLSLEGRDDIKEVLEKVYEEAASFHLKRHEELLNEIERQNLLSPFYRTLLFGVHEIGKALSLWQPKWTKYIVNTINPSLLKEFGGDKEIASFLSSNSLFDVNPDGSFADRSYSALIKEDGEYKNAPYAVVFFENVQNVVSKIDKLMQKLQNENDDVYNAKEAYIVYLAALKNAFGVKDNAKVISSWQDVDRAWMNIKTPFQIAHPLEYYEDHYKKAVALEWDVRMQDPEISDADTTKSRILSMYKELFRQADNQNRFADICEKSLQNIEKTSLYISRPMLYYAAQFNGLFSAQVVPNDEIVSKELGKKIFAYADNVLDSVRAKPFMRISSEVFGAKFMRLERELVFKKPSMWRKVYEYTTIGHEFGHILWIDDDTESKMNKSGVFKNIEEFKATAGGLCAFFKQADETLLSYVVNDTIKRSVGLIAWMKTDETQAYYCECLMHLQGLFESGILSFADRLQIDASVENIDALINWYFETYIDLARHYLQKRDAREFLDKFAIKEGDFYLPADKTIRRFVEYYWELHRTIGREIDTSDRRENWI